MKIQLYFFTFFIFLAGQNLSDFKFAKYLFDLKEFELSLIPLHYQYKQNRNDSSLKYILLSYDSLKRYDEAIGFIEKKAENNNHRFYFFLKKTDSEIPLLKNLNTGNKLILKKLNDVILNYKRPFTYGLSSALVPGLGKFLLGNNSDGFAALTTNFLFAYLAYDSYIKNDKNFKTSTGIYSAFFLYFYLGNIYGTVKEVNRVNAGIYLNKRRELALSLRLNF